MGSEHHDYNPDSKIGRIWAHAVSYIKSKIVTGKSDKGGERFLIIGLAPWQREFDVEPSEVEDMGDRPVTKMATTFFALEESEALRLYESIGEILKQKASTSGNIARSASASVVPVGGDHD